MEKNIETITEHSLSPDLIKTLVYLISRSDGCKSSDIEEETQLRQPDVTTAMEELRKRGWATKRDFLKKGKSRPIHIYKPTKDISKILKSLDKETLNEVEDIKSDLIQLQDLISLIESKTKREEISKPIFVEKGMVRMKIDKMDENIMYPVQLKGKDFSVQKKDNGNISIYEVFK